MIALDDAFDQIRHDVTALLVAPAVLLRDAKPPNVHGVYMFLCDGVLLYVGEAKGSAGLYDRVVRKHLSGDDGHALQAAFAAEFPNRLQRRAFLKDTIQVRWLAIESSARIAAVERVLIWLHKPPLNRT